MATDVDKHEEVLRQVLELDIIAAYYYQAGAIEAGLKYDRQLKEAVRLLKNTDEYRKLLAPKKVRETSSMIELPKKPQTPITLERKPVMPLFDAIA